MEEKAPLPDDGVQQPAFAPGTTPAPPTYNDSVQPGQPMASGYVPGQPAAYPPGMPPPQMIAPAGYSGQVPQMAPGYTPVPTMQAGQMYYPPAPVAAAGGKPGMMPPPQQMQPGMQPQVVQQTVIVNAQPLGTHPVQMSCPRCHQTIVTETRKYGGQMAWMWCIIIFLLGGGLCCLCFIPFCVDGMMDTKHTCPVRNCRHVIGTRTGKM